MAEMYEVPGDRLRELRESSKQVTEIYRWLAEQGLGTGWIPEKPAWLNLKRLAQVYMDLDKERGFAVPDENLDDYVHSILVMSRWPAE